MNSEIKQIVETLPSAACRWLQNSLPEDFGLPSSVAIEQEGEMEIRGSWTSFKATGIYKSPPLSFNWQARLKMMPGVWIVAEDGHLGDQGWGGAKLWGVIPMGKRTDPEVLATQLVRNVGELPWIPGLALADTSLEWSSIDDGAFELRTGRGNDDLVVRFELNEGGDVIRAFSQARPYDVPDGYQEAPWSVEYGDHRRFGGIRMPGTAVATYHKEDGDWEYFRARIIDISLETAA
jgi:hypothetical protein